MTRRIATEEQPAFAASSPEPWGRATALATTS
jgi:hypothetical protein